LINTTELPLEVLGSDNITSLNSATKLTGIPAGATIVHLTATTQNVRVTLDGTTPTASVGERIVAGGETRKFNLTDLSNIQVIEETASASLHVNYFRPKAIG
jgi:hypothetical protein